MAYEIGTATNYSNLLARLKDFISNPDRTDASGDASILELVAIDSDLGSGESSQAWTIDRYAAGDEMIAHGPGLSGDIDTYIGIKLENGTIGAGDYFNWLLQGFTGYSSVDDFGDQPGAMSAINPPHILLWNDPIDYWFFANGRRIIVVANVGGIVYEMCYLGLLLPYATPTQYAYPLVIGGTWGQADGTDGRYSDVTVEHSAFWDDRNTANAWANDGTCKVMYSTIWSSYNNKASSPYSERHVNPWGRYFSSQELIWQDLRGQLDSGYTLFPAIVVNQDPVIGMLGELQGLYGVAADTPVVLDVVTIDTEDYIVFPNVFRTAAYSYCAVKKE